MRYYIAIFLLSCVTVFADQTNNLASMNILITPNSGVSESIVRDILSVRPKTDTNAVWHVDMSKGDVRIQIKDRAGHFKGPPGGAVEFWYKDAAGKWKARLTA